MYLVLKGIDGDRITILSTYNGQKELIREILTKKCSWHQRFGKPRKITTVDRYQGQQNDFVIFSMVRTKNYGFIKDQRRFVVALSRARLGLYVLGHMKLWGNCRDTSQSFSLFKKRETSLAILPDETPEQVQERIVKPPKSQITFLRGYNHMYKIIERLLSAEMKIEAEMKAAAQKLEDARRVAEA
jgi:intron-binding protein aquarius